MLEIGIISNLQISYIQNTVGVSQLEIEQVSKNEGHKESLS
jgi:hypothetical protein